MIIKNKNLFLNGCLIFLFFCILSIFSFIGYCKIYTNYGFDSQALLAWNYSSYKGFLPYKDTFYPYGLLSYYENNILFFQLTSFFIGPILYTLFFMVIKKVWQDKLYTLLIFILFYFFIEKFIGHDVFNRYGIITILACIAAYLFFRFDYLPSKITLVLGITIGLIFSLVNDQGAYGVLIVSLFILFNPIIKYGFRSILSRNYFKFTGKSIILFSLGIIIGVIPFAVYLTYYDILYDFYVSFIRLSDSALYAKTAFIPYSRSPENLFTFVSIFLTIFYIIYNKFFRKIDFNFILYLQLSLISVLILLEQKSLIRSISEQITFISFLLFMLLFYDLRKFLEKLKISSLSILICSSILGIFILYRMPFKYFNAEYNLANLDPKACLNKNINNFLTNHKEYALIKQRLEKDFGYKGKIFSFPGDPIFYLIFNQVPPYYSNNYDSSSINAQKKQIAYLKKNSVDYVIYNLNVPAIQDSVPNYIRTPEEMKYILNNFHIVDYDYSFLVLKRNNNNEDFFNSILLDKLPDFRNYLLDINLAAIPMSEGTYKSKSIVASTSVDKINKFLNDDYVDISDSLLILTANQYKNKDKYVSISLQENGGKITTVKFYRCEISKSCIVNLSKIPLFYKKRIVKKLMIDPDFYGKIEIVKYDRESSLW